MVLQLRTSLFLNNRVSRHPIFRLNHVNSRTDVQNVSYFSPPFLFMCLYKRTYTRILLLYQHYLILRVNFLFLNYPHRNLDI